MPVRDTSREAFEELTRTGHLQKQEAEVMLAAYRLFQDRTFTRRELSELSQIPVNCVCGRVNSLVERGMLEELAERRGKSHLLRIAFRRRQADLFPAEQTRAPELQQGR